MNFLCPFFIEGQEKIQLAIKLCNICLGRWCNYQSPVGELVLCVWIAVLGLTEIDVKKAKSSLGKSKIEQTIFYS